jgi:hypothetical protein
MFPNTAEGARHLLMEMTDLTEESLETAQFQEDPQIDGCWLARTNEGKYLIYVKPHPLGNDLELVDG